MLIRSARPEDLPTLLEYEQGVISAERPFDPTLKKDPINYYDLEKMIVDDNVKIVVAESNSKIIACGYARIEEAKPYLAHDEHAYLGFMFVHPDHRGEGLNAKIIAALQEWSLARNITEMRLEVYHENISAIRAYEKIGFVKHMIEMRLRLNE